MKKRAQIISKLKCSSNRARVTLMPGGRKPASVPLCVVRVRERENCVSVKEEGISEKKELMVMTRTR